MQVQRQLRQLSSGLLPSDSALRQMRALDRPAPSDTVCSHVIATIGTTTRFHADFSGGEQRGGGFIY